MVSSVRRAWPPDGYTLAQMPITALRVPLLSARPPFDPLTDFTWIIQLTGYLFGVVVRADAPWRSFREFLDDAKSHPGRIVYGTPGAITTPHLVMERIAAREGIAWVHVPFRGTSENLEALLAGRLDAAADASGWATQVQAGRLQGQRMRNHKLSNSRDPITVRRHQCQKNYVFFDHKAFLSHF